MKLLTQSVLALSLFGAATVAMAAEPILGKWTTSEGAVVEFTQQGQTFSGKILSTKKDQSLVNTIAIWDLKADGGGKYSQGQAKHPILGKVKMSATINGDTMTVIGKKALIKKKQIWKRN